MLLMHGCDFSLFQIEMVGKMLNMIIILLVFQLCRMEQDGRVVIKNTFTLEIK